MKKEKIYLIFFILAMIIYNGATIEFSLSFKNMLDSLTSNSYKIYYESIYRTIIVVVVQILSYNIYSRLKNKRVKLEMIQLKGNLLKKIFSFSIPDFQKSDLSKYISFLFNDLQRYEENYIVTRLNILENIFLLIFAVYGVVFIFPSFLIVITIMLLLSTVLPFLLGKKAKYYSKILSNAYRLTTDKITEMLKGFNVVKFSRFDTIAINECIQETEDLEDKKCTMKNYMIMVQCFLMFMTTILTLLVFIFAGNLVIRGILTVGSLIALIQLLFNITSPINNIMTSINRLKSVQVIKDDCDKILNYKGSINKKEFPENMNRFVQLENVSYKYSKDNTHYAIKNFNFKFNKNKKYVIVGENGCGKSTVLKLISNYVDGYEGNILFDNYNIKNLAENYIYDNIAYITQDTYLFKKSILENITLFREYDKNTFKNLVDHFMIKDFASKHVLGMNCNVDELNSISGGEKQKIVLARELLKKADILLADEPDSALDSKSTSSLFETILSLVNTTCIIVTHKITSELSKFDTILVMDKGELVEFGDYEKLINNKGLFYDKLFGCVSKNQKNKKDIS